MNVRQAERNDLERIVEIYNSTIPGRMVTADTEAVTVESRVDWFDAHQGNKPLYVIEKGIEIVGWLSFSDFYSRPAYDRTVEVSIYVDERFRGQGIGQYAVDKMKELATELDFKTLLAFIFSHNIPSIRLFEKNGFVLYGALPDIAEMDGQCYSLSILGCKISNLH
ncbi:GNAT family N-acetyltransferase [Macrococcus carouselicus]|uniref:N-acetyltransferase family protein n=1 Tax=Macrococcus carouselicus TaxID=69969 RepID=A0A9Q8CLR4_9STAP|nr:GNAT family N-acetyltransferase [Macrococcus carouselicus]TDM04406.1 N-acetyltransferase family protein [Macrococcus carouselicus]